MSDGQGQKIINRIDGPKGLVLTFGIVSIGYILLIFTAFGFFSAENNAGFNGALLKVILLSIPYFVVIYFSYLLYVTKSVKQAKNVLLIFGIAMILPLIFSFIELSWFNVFLFGIIIIEIANLYNKVLKLEP